MHRSTLGTIALALAVGLTAKANARLKNIEFVRLEPELARELRDRAERRRLGDLQAADHASFPGSGRAVWSRPRKLLAHALVLESALSLTTTGPSSIDSSSP